MTRIIALAALLVLIVLLLSGLTSFGLTGPDEPRYASIGRAMAVGGDWITPHLWGHAWFEKPPLLYWMAAVGFRLRMGTELAPRLPVALLSLAFLVFYFLSLRREFNLFVGGTAAGLLATSALWVGYSHVSVTDIPLAVTFGAALLLLLPAAEGRSVPLNIAAVFLALSVLAKGLLPLILLLPFFWFARAGWRKWLSPRPVFVFCLIALPWYILCQLRNPQFFDVFFVQQQFGRFTSPDLQHVQPFWFYLPVLAGALFPSTFLGVFALWPRMYQDQRRKLLGVVVLFGFVFLSAARNKLPGYILPLLPAVCVLIACGIDAARVLHPRLLGVVLALSALTIPGFVVAAGILPLAVNGGLRHAVSLDGTTSTRIWTAIPLGLLAAGCLYFLTRDFLTRAKAMMLWFTLAAGGWIYMEYSALPGLDLTSSARSLWRDLPDPKRDFCVGPVGRNWRYGLNYYSVFPLKDCAGNEKLAIRPGPSPSGRPLF